MPVYIGTVRQSLQRTNPFLPCFCERSPKTAGLLSLLGDLLSLKEIKHIFVLPLVRMHEDKPGQVRVPQNAVA